jgi:hypothetical protein
MWPRPASIGGARARLLSSLDQEPSDVVDVDDQATQILLPQPRTRCYPPHGSSLEQHSITDCSLFWTIALQLLSQYMNCAFAARPNGLGAHLHSKPAATLGAWP